MIKFNFTIAFILLISIQAFSQKKAPYQFLKSGQISIEDLMMGRYEADTSAGAVILYDGGKTRYSPNATNGLSLSHERHVIIKILKKSGYDAANIEFPLFRNENRSEKLQGLSGFSYNLVNGKIVIDKLGKDAIFEEKTTPNYNTQKFTLPNVKEGTILEYTYRISSPFIYTFQLWNFQHELPVAWSEYRAEIPDNFEYKTMVQGYEPFAFMESVPTSMSLNFTEGNLMLKGQEKLWVMKNVPALREEPFISSVFNYQARIEFELTNINTKYYTEERKQNTWEKVSEAILKSNNFGIYFSRTNFVKDVLHTITAGISDPDKKIAAIHHYIRNNITWNNYNSFTPNQSLRVTLEKKKGSAAEINLLLLCFLREAGFTAEPVLLSTRRNGLVTSVTFPNIQKFNYVVVYTKSGDKEYLLDATDPLSGLNTLPERCLNGEGLILNASEAKWVNLRNTGKASQMYYTKVTIGKDLSMQGKLQASCNGHLALSLRKEISEQGDKKFISNLVGKCETWEMDTYTLQPITDPADPLKFEINFTIPAKSSGASAIYLQPVMNQAFRLNPLKTETRKFPVDFTFPKEETLIYNYTIPEGYKVDEQPKDVIYSLPDNAGKYSFSITSVGNSINVISRLSIEKAVFLTEEYPNLKEFYNLVLAKQAEQIVLKRI